MFLLVCCRFYCKGEGQGRERWPVDCSKGRQCSQHQSTLTASVPSHLKHQWHWIGGGRWPETETSVSTGRPNTGQRISSTRNPEIPGTCCCPDSDVLPACLGPRLWSGSTLYFQARIASATSADFLRLSVTSQWAHVAVPARMVSAFRLRETIGQYARACNGAGDGWPLAVVECRDYAASSCRYLSR